MSSGIVIESKKPDFFANEACKLSVVGKCSDRDELMPIKFAKTCSITFLQYSTLKLSCIAWKKQVCQQNVQFQQKGKGFVIPCNAACTSIENVKQTLHCWNNRCCIHQILFLFCFTLFVWSQREISANSTNFLLHKQHKNIAESKLKRNWRCLPVSSIILSLQRFFLAKIENFLKATRVPYQWTAGVFNLWRPNEENGD